jgi:hypothetical protein
MKISLFTYSSRQASGPIQPPILLVPRAVSPRVKRPQLEADGSPPSNAEVKNAGSYAFTHHISSLRGV